MDFLSAIEKLKQMGYSISKVIIDGEITGLEVYSSALVMDDREKLIKEVLPEFNVNGIKWREIIEINL